MRLENRTCEFVEDTGHSKVYKLKCSLGERFKLQKYIVEEEPLVGKSNGVFDSIKWEYACYTEDKNSYLVFNNGKEDEKTVYDEHMTFIIPDYWCKDKRKLKEGFYEAGEYENTPPSLSSYVRLKGYGGNKDYDYLLQYMGGSGDEEYCYLKQLCDIEDAFVYRHDVVSWKGKDEEKDLLISMLPIGVRTNITVEVPYDELFILEGKGSFMECESLSKKQ